MKIALFISAVCCLSMQQDVPTATFTEPFAGFQFNYPKNWTIVKSNKRKDRARTSFSIPIQGSTDKAFFEVDHTEFHASTDLWQTIQLRINEELHRLVVRQWTQEVLGVSMLFSRIEYTDRGTPMVAVTGLFYTRTSQKLLLRLEGPRADFDKLFYDFNQLLQTLQQTDGKLPLEDNPSLDLPSETSKPTLAPVKPHALDATSKRTSAKFKAPISIGLVVSTKKVTLRVPLGWTGDKVKGNELDVVEPSLGSPLHIQSFTTLDSDPPMTALTKLSAGDLNSFTSVSSREDSNPATNRAGCLYATVWRVGKNASGPIATCEAMGSMGDYYFLLTYRQTNLTQFKADRKLIEQLLKQISIELEQ